MLCLLSIAINHCKIEVLCCQSIGLDFLFNEICWWIGDCEAAHGSSLLEYFSLFDSLNSGCFVD